MTRLVERAIGLFHLGLLRAASAIAPGRRRTEWWREWRAELWHVRRVCAPDGCASWPGVCEVTAFCLGAFQDALCLRRQCRQGAMRFGPPRGSAAQCVLFLAAVSAASCLAALVLPGVRAERLLSHYRAYSGAVLIQDADVDAGVDAGGRGDASPSIPPQQFREWAASPQRYFDGLAFYRVAPERVLPARGEWKIAYASANLFALLGLPVRFAPGNQNMSSDLPGNLPELILSDEAWKRDFGGDSHVAGKVVHVGRREARIAGVAPAGSWRLPGEADGWLLEPDSAFASGRAGYVVAHLTAAGESEMWAPRVLITAYKPDDSAIDLIGISLDERAPPSWAVFLFGVLLALFALPATTPVSMGEYSLMSHKPSWPRRLCRWGFLSAKIALLLLTIDFASLDIAYARMAPFSPNSVYLQFASSFLLCLFGMRWVLRDQRQRCPVCLHCVAHPATVGQPSRTFLAWNGTELMCTGGHSLLHVPGLPTSWFSTQRWLFLDPSWEFLFDGAARE